MKIKQLIYKGLIAFFYCMVCIGSFAQSAKNDFYSKEFSVKTENDAYLFKLDDAYYTNGFFLNYSFVSTKNAIKKIHTVEVGQKIFTPLIRNTLTAVDIDRPYAGYLYLSYGQTSFIKKDAVLQLTGSLGVVGPASGGEWLQNTYHRWLKYAKFTGWKYQIENALGIDAAVTYAATLAGNETIKLVPVVQANLGTTFINAKLGAMVVLGAFEKNSESALWNARISSTPKKRNHELYLYLYPQVVAQGYNATIQGGIFKSGTTEVTRNLSTFMFQQTIGLCFAQGRFTSKLEWVYQSKETPAQTLPQRYGSILLTYRIH